MATHIQNSKNFYKTISDIAEASNVSMFDAVMEYIGTANIEIETIATFIKRSPNLKAKIESECFELNLLQPATTSNVHMSKDDNE